MPYVKMPSNEQLRSVTETPDVIISEINFRTKFQEILNLDMLNVHYDKICNEEKRIRDINSEEYEICINEKKLTAKLISQKKNIIQKHTIEFEELNIRDCGKMIKNLEIEILKLDDEILNDDDDDDDELPVILQRMKETLETLQIKDAELRQEHINNFKNNAKHQRKQSMLDDTTKVFNIAKRDASDRVMEIIILEDDEIASMFSTSCHKIEYGKGPQFPTNSFVTWPHIIKGYQNNIIPLSPGIEIPKKFDQTTKTYKDYNFTLSSFFRNPKFIQLVNKHYNKLGLSMGITQDKKFKNKWHIRLNLLGDSIKFPEIHEESTFINTKVTNESSF